MNLIMDIDANCGHRFETNSIALHLNTMEGQKITQAIATLFKGIDDRDWSLGLTVLAKEVFLDYSSMNNTEPSVYNHEQVINAWESFLTGFDKTEHQLSEFKVQLHDKEADVFYVGKADHFIGDEVWTTIGTYNTKLEKQNGKWLIVYHQINHDRQSGNTSLAKLAHQNVLARRNK